MNALREILDKISYISLPNIGVRDILDILIVTYLIYLVMIWIKDARTWTLFKGIVSVLIIAGLAYIFQLHTLWFVLSNTITVGSIALLVVFQPELRRALEQIGQGKFFESLLTNPDDLGDALSNGSIDHIVKACMHMSKCKTGALIVFEQDTKLGDVERTGIKIDAEISSQLLINIFEKNTPLHDGAVIIKNNRISAATCFLPLSDSMEISKDLGTRHRAAIGITEGTDALVLVVSEETGIISSVRNGRINRGLDSEMIKRILLMTKKRKRLEQRKRNEKKKTIWKGKEKK